MDKCHIIHCCKPFTFERCSKKLKPLKICTAKKIPKLSELDEADLRNYRICSSCEIKVGTGFIEQRINITSSVQISPIPTTSQKQQSLASLSTSSPTSTVVTDSESPSSSEESILKKRRMLEILNKTITPNSPIYLSNMHQKRQQDKLLNITSTVMKDIVPIQTRSIEHKAILYEECIDQLKTKYAKLEKNCDKVQLLTVLPASLTHREIIEEFGCTWRNVKIAKDLQNDSGALTMPGPKHGRPLSEKTIADVDEFYNNDEISRVMPGKNDCVSVRQGLEKVKIQKRLMMNTLKESYEEFKKRHPSVKIGFSKFCLLRPKNCVQPGSSGTHSICVCTIHQNVKLMIANTKIGVISNGELNNYKDCIGAVLCGEPNPECYLMKCTDCPGIDNFKDIVRGYFVEHGCEDTELQFNQWISTDRCYLETLIKPVEDFLDYFMEKLEKLIPHYFISMQQSNFLTEMKNKLGENELLVYGDFAENYSFIFQNEAQGIHWNNQQATIHPFTIYYRDTRGELQHLTFTIISDCLNHDTIAVNLFIKKLINFIKNTFDKPILKIFYITDGAASQYKNKKNFINVISHHQDFGIQCEWHFHATSHGKGPCDGIGGTLKRKAARASLTTEYNKIISTPRELYEWATTALKINVCFATMEEYEERKLYLEPRFKGLATIIGTRQFHAFIPLENNRMKVKYYSNAEEAQIFEMYDE